MRAAIYARMSTDKQSERSPEDQVARCRDFATDRGWEAPAELVFVDAGISGATRHNRAGLLAMLDRIAEWDVLLVFDDSRLARNTEDAGWVRNQLEEHGRTGFDVSTGLELSNVGSQVMSVMSAEQRKKIAADTKRGQRGQFERGFATGGVAYGYRLEARRGDGTRRDSELVLVPEEAAVVRRMFAMYADGQGIKAIAHALNAEGVAPPRPRAMKLRPASWAPTAIREMLRNELYRGVRVWNRSRWVRGRNGKRRRIERPAAEWVRQVDERWRIVEDARWWTVREQAERRAGRKRSIQGRDGVVRLVPAPEANPNRRRLLAGFLECGVCGGAFYSVRPSGVMGCSWRQARGRTVCRSEVLVPAAALEARVLGALRSEILVPENVAYMAHRALEEVRAARAPADADRSALLDLDRQVARLVEAVALADDVPELVARLRETRARRDALRARLEGAELDLADDELTALVMDEIAGVEAALAGEPEECRRGLRHLLGDRRLRVLADADRGFRVEGALRLRLEVGNPPEAHGRRAGCQGGSGGGI